ncbi:ubiquitin-conjugating enzyme E2 O protein [Dioscorea alata]|uniref:Ubiquitin-conjugating enzyme E2 O protein n=1 Tax=Dioscorea alata TaxID=55571 RepID=A0ACB7WNU7_DIOAL|nr:ubiquitin-conjugating enzyme E2 O protein [Dioscorea alata]
MESEHLHDNDKLSDIDDSVELKAIKKLTDPASNVSESILDGNSGSDKTNIYQRPSLNLSNEAFVYRQDVVRCKHNKDLIGVVLEVAGESDSEGSVTDDSESDEDEDKHSASPAAGQGNDGDDADMENSGNVEAPEETDSLPDGQVRVIWADGSETTNDLGDIELVDRGFLHGDIIASLSDPTGQLGLVVDVNISVDLQAVNGDMIKGVPSRDLKRIREFYVGDYVVSGPWLGRVNDVLDNVTVMFDDGSVCKVLKADPMRLKAVSKPVVDDANCPYYPGQRVKAASSVFKNSRWLYGLWKANRLEGTVTKVEVASVVVYWIASAYLGVHTNSAAVPSEEQSPKNLTLLSCFSDSHWQLGDWCLLPSVPCVNGTSNTSINEPSVECRSYLKHSKECSVNQCTDTCETNCVQGSQLAVDDLVTSEHQALDGHDTEVCTQDNTVTSSHLSSFDISDHHLVSGHQSLSSEVSEECHSQSNCPTKPNTGNNFGETNGIESDDVLPQCDSSSGSTAVSKEAAHESWPLYRKKLRKVLFKRDKKARKRDETFERALCIVNIRTTVDVAWQDGTKEFGRDSKSIIPIHSPNDHEFFPEQYVVEQASGEGDDSSETKRVGVVRSVNSKERTVCVRWCKPVTRPEDTREFDCDEVVSAYELDGHPDYDYCYGDVVVRLAPASDSAENAYCGSPDNESNQQIDPTEEGAASKEDSNVERQTDKDASGANFTSLSWVGNITGLHEGDIEVTWADGMVSMVGPQAVYVVSQEDDGDSFDGGSEVSDAAASWETVDDNEMDLDDNEKEADPRYPSTKSNEEDKTTATPSEFSCTERNGPLSMPLAALGFVTRFATGLFSRGKKAEQPELEHLVGEGEETEALEGETADVKHGFDTSDALDKHNPQNGLELTEECNNNSLAEDTEMQIGKDLGGLKSVEIDADGTRSHSEAGFFDFKHFDITENPLDHHFLGGSGQGAGGRKWIKKIQQEWSILEKNLPDAIYVRVFEDRMDLLRAVIVGACGTPYQDGLFFFDFQLPPDYPQVPPSAFYHSGGLRVNPNLYVDGKVCLSLLNTWTGKGNEVWDPSTSSVLQVLVSLQGLVLNAKPYFNEAGYEKQVGTIEGEKNSLPYNENTYLLNLKSMLYLLRRPPMHFEDFVKDHFRRRGLHILKACEAYMDGCMIASLTTNASMTEKSREQPCSIGFKLMLAKMIPRLVSAFSELGVDCDQFKHLLKS